MTNKKQFAFTKATLVAILIAAALIVILSVSALILSLTPKKQTPTATPPANAGNDTEAVTRPTTPTETSPTDVSAYETLINYLQAEILNLKQEAYVTRVEYEARMESLNQALQNALNQAESPSGTDVSVSVTPTAPADGTSVFGYTVTDGKVTIHSYTGSSLHVIVPATIGDRPVTHIADNAFRGSAVKTVILPHTLESIGWFAFADNASLTSVTIPATVTTIGYGAFENTPSLTLAVDADSYAHAYARSFAIPCAAGEN